MAEAATRLLNRVCYRGVERKMIVLDQDAVEQPHPMVHTATARDRVFIKHAQAGAGFAGVNNASPRALNAIDISSRERSNTAQALKEIERDAFRHQDGTSRTTNICDRCAAGHGIGVGDEN